jgi:hypothetical protein
MSEASTSARDRHRDSAEEMKMRRRRERETSVTVHTIKTEEASENHGFRGPRLSRTALSQQGSRFRRPKSSQNNDQASTEAPQCQKRSPDPSPKPPDPRSADPRRVMSRGSIQRARKDPTEHETRPHNPYHQIPGLSRISESRKEPEDRTSALPTESPDPHSPTSIPFLALARLAKY